MKKIGQLLILGLSLSLMLCQSAMAQTTGIQVDGKTYTFTGGEGTYKADGKTFIIGENTVTVQQPDKPDRVFALTKTGEGEEAVRESAVFLEQGTQMDTALYDTVTPLTGYVHTSTGVEDVVVEDSRENSADLVQRFAPYAAFGLYYDAAADVLTYQGQRVRIFEDSYPLDDFSCAGLEHVDVQGTIDVKTTRDLSVRVYNADGSYNPAGTLTGLYVLTDAEYSARNLRDWTQPQQQLTAVSGEDLTPAQKQAIYAPYASFGLVYDAAHDTLSYQGKRVRQFMDIRQSNGESLESGRFKGVMTCIGGDDGEVDIQTVRDFSTPDVSGDGTLIGLSVQKVR